MSPGMHVLATRQSPFIRKCTRYWLTEPVRLERLQMAWAMSRTFPLCRNKLVAPDYEFSGFHLHLDFVVLEVVVELLDNLIVAS